MNRVIARSGVRSRKFRVDASDVADQLSDRIQAWSGTGKRLALSTNGFVRARPWQAVGLVAVAGLLTGLLVSYAARVTRSAREFDVNYDEMSGG